MAMLPPDPVFVLKGNMDNILCLVYKITSDAEYLYAGTHSGKVHIWDLKTNREVDKIDNGKESCLSLHLTEKGGNNLIIQNKIGLIRFWRQNTNTWVCTNELLIDYCGFCKCVLHKDVLFAPFKDSQIRMFNLMNKEPVDVFKPQDDEKVGEVMCLKVLNLLNKKHLLVAFESGHLFLWNLEVKTKTSDLKLDDCPMAMDFDTSTMKGLCGNPSEKLVVFNMDRLCLGLHVQRMVVLMNPGVACVSIRPDSKLVAVGCWDGKLRLYSWKNLAILAVLDTHAATVQDVCFSPSKVNAWDCTFLLAAGSKDSRISLWNLYN